MRGLLLLIVYISFQACGINQGLRHSTHGNSSLHSEEPEPGSPFHSLRGWPVTIKFFVANDAPIQLVEASVHAATTWNQAIGRNLLQFAGRTSNSRGDTLYNSLDDDLTVIYYEQNWTKTTGKSDSTLATTIWENDGQSDAIVKGDIIMNAELYQFVDAMEDQDTDSNRDIADSESVLVHELGHLIGLDHVSLEKDSLSVMHAQTQIGHQISFRDLSPADMANIRTLYP